jgi:hypothetical protein
MELENITTVLRNTCRWGPTIPTISSHSSDGYFPIIPTGHFPFFPIVLTKNKGSHNSNEGSHNSDSKNAFFPQFRRQKKHFSKMGRLFNSPLVLPGEAPQTKKQKKNINKKSQMNQK